MKTTRKRRTIGGAARICGQAIQAEATTETRRRGLRDRQTGAAVIMALLVVAIAALVVSGTFQRQSVVARNVENYSAASQANWLMAGAVDWVRVILREDARASTTDYLAEPWAVPVAQTRLNDDDRDPAWLSGKIEDEQARFNLFNLVGPDGPIPAEIAVLGRLLAVTGLDETRAEPLAMEIDYALSRRPGGNLVTPATIDEMAIRDSQLQTILAQLKPFVTILPVTTPVNANTASAEVLSAVFENVSLADARRLVASRDRAAFKDLADVLNRLPDLQPSARSGKLDVATRFFILEGEIEYQRARIHQRALLQRQLGRVEMIWKREVRT